MPTYPYTVFFTAPQGFAVRGKTTDRLVMHVRGVTAEAAMTQAQNRIGPAFHILYAVEGFVPLA